MPTFEFPDQRAMLYIRMNDGLTVYSTYKTIFFQGDALHFIDNEGLAQRVEMVHIDCISQIP